MKSEPRQLYSLVKFTEPRLDCHSSSELRPLVEEALLLSNKTIILDLEPVKYLDSTGFSAILLANRICIEAGGELFLINAQENVRRLIKMAHLEEIINLKINLWDAIGEIITHQPH